MTAIKEKEIGTNSEATVDEQLRPPNSPEDGKYS